MNKILKSAIATLLSAGLLAGCGAPAASGSGSTSATSSESGSSSPADAAQSQVIDIAIFEGGLGAAYWEEMMAKYKEANPGVEFKVTMSPKIGEIIRPRIVAGDAPDFLVMTDGDQSGLLVAMMKDKALTDLTDVFEGPAYDSETPLKEIIKPGFLESTKCSPYGDGKIYLAPRDCGPCGLIYNKTLFEQKGWKVPTTWDEFFALGDEAKKDGRALFTYQGIYPGYLENFLIPALMNSVGEKGMQAIYNYEEGSFATPEVMRVLEQFEKIAKGGYLMEGTVALNHTQSQTDMLMGKALFITNGPWMVNEMAQSEREEGFSYGLMTAPVFNAGDPSYVFSNYGQYCIPAGAKNPEGAKDFLRFLYTQDSAVSMAKTSTTVLAINGAEEMVKEHLPADLLNLFDVFKTSTAFFANFSQLPTGSKIDVADVLYNNGGTKVMSGQATAAEWSEIVEKAFAQIRDEQAKAAK